MSNIIAIIVAAGSGTRFGAKKQFLEVAGKPLYYYSIKAFKPYADYIILVVPEEDVDTVEPYGAIVVAGGKNRYNSVYNAIKEIPGLNNYRDSGSTRDNDRNCAINQEKTRSGKKNGSVVGTDKGAYQLITEDSIVMIHDGARPAITSDVIERVIADTESYGAAVACVQVVDTIRTIDGELIDRSKLRAMQTPQSFRYGLLRDSFEKLMNLPEEAISMLHITDDVQVVYQMSGVNAKLTEGDARNIKVTTPIDIENLHLS